MKPITHIFTIAILAMASSLHAQTIPDPVDDEPASLLIHAISDDTNEGDVFVSDIPTSPVLNEAETPQKTADEGIQIQVEKAKPKLGATANPGPVKILSPWPAKPIAVAPKGWEFAPAPSGLAPYSKNVKLESGNEVVISVTPFVLEPLSDGLNAIRISEPGYDPAQKYQQKDTMGTMLQNSTMELEHNEKQAASAIRRLQLLLSSLPKQE